MRSTFFLLLLTVYCLPMKAQTPSFTPPAFDIEGHRGWRGKFPENTIAGFIEAVKLGVNTLEMDAVISKDGKVLLSHDPVMNSDICSTPDGKPVTSTYRIYDMTYEEITKFDCGLRGNPKFPEQQKMAVHKPLLSEVIDSVESYIARHKLPAVQYNIETKSTPAGDDVEHPKPAVFAKMLYDVVNSKHILPQVIIQSFDPRTLQEMKHIDASLRLALLVFNADGFEKNVSRLGFMPHIYSPNVILVNKKLVKKCKAESVQLIPWTVNEEKKMLKLKAMGVDGIISDYPERAIKVLR